MSIEQRSHELRKRLEAKYHQKISRSHITNEDGLFYTIDDNSRNDSGALLYRRHRQIQIR